MAVQPPPLLLLLLLLLQLLARKLMTDAAYAVVTWRWRGADVRRCAPRCGVARY